jgi:hypothetical protein
MLGHFFIGSFKNINSIPLPNAGLLKIPENDPETRTRVKVVY